MLSIVIRKTIANQKEARPESWQSSFSCPHARAEQVGFHARRIALFPTGEDGSLQCEAGRFPIDGCQIALQKIHATLASHGPSAQQSRLIACRWEQTSKLKEFSSFSHQTALKGRFHSWQHQLLGRFHWQLNPIGHPTIVAIEIVSEGYHRRLFRYGNSAENMNPIGL